MVLRSLCSPTSQVRLPPRCAGAQQPVLCLEQLMKMHPRGALLSTVHSLHRMCKLGEIRRLACTLRRFPFVAQPNCGEDGGGTSHQRGCRFSLARKGSCTVFQRAKRVWLVFLRAIARLYGFIILAPNIFEGAHHNPHGRRPYQTFAPFAPSEPSRPPGRVHKPPTRTFTPKAAGSLRSLPLWCLRHHLSPSGAGGTMGAGRRRHTHRSASFSPPM